MSFPTGGKYSLKVTTGIRVLPDTLPYAAPKQQSAAAASAPPPPPQQFDLVVYGGTAGGVMTAVSGAREGLKVALLEPGKHLGGMVSGGLGWTDYGKKEVIGGYSLEFFERVGTKYGREIEWHLEPHVAEGGLRRAGQGSRGQRVPQPPTPSAGSRAQDRCERVGCRARER